MTQDPRVGCTQIPLHLSGRRIKDREEAGGASSDFSKKYVFCMVAVPVWHPGCGAEGLVHICTWTHHPLKWSLPSHSGGSSGSSASRSWSGSGWGSGCQKAQPGSSLFGSWCLLPYCWLVKTPWSSSQLNLTLNCFYAYFKKHESRDLWISA